MLAKTLVDFAAGPLLGLSNQPRRVRPQIQRDASVGVTQGAAAGPDHLAHRDQLIEQLRSVVTHPHREHVTLEHRRGDGAALQLEDDLGEPVKTAGLDANAVPARQKPAEDLDRHRLDLASERGERFAAERPEHVGVAVLATRLARSELSGDDVAAAGQLAEGILHFAHR